MCRHIAALVDATSLSANSGAGALLGWSAATPKGKWARTTIHLVSLSNNRMVSQGVLAQFCTPQAARRDLSLRLEYAGMRAVCAWAHGPEYPKVPEDSVRPFLLDVFDLGARLLGESRMDEVLAEEDLGTSSGTEAANGR